MTLVIRVFGYSDIVCSILLTRHFSTNFNNVPLYDRDWKMKLLTFPTPSPMPPVRTTASPSMATAQDLWRALVSGASTLHS